MAQLNPIDLINYCIQHAPEALGVIAFGPRVKRVKFVKHQGLPSIEVNEKGERVRQTHRTAMVLAEMPERIGANLKGPAEDQDFMIMFVVDRAVYDRLQRQAASGLILPPGAQI